MGAWLSVLHQACDGSVPLHVDHLSWGSSLMRVRHWSSLGGWVSPMILISFLMHTALKEMADIIMVSG